MNSGWLNLSDHQLFMVEKGPSGGPAVVLLHHGLGTERSWKGQIPVLAKAGFRVIAYDRWGYGRSDPRPHSSLGSGGHYSMPSFDDDQEDLLSLLDRLHVEGAVLIGHSDGGTIALYMAARHPERVTALVTLAAHAYLDEAMVSGIQEVHRQYEVDTGFRTRMARRQGKNAHAVFLGWYEGWLRKENLAWDIRPELSKIVCPALVVQGSQDEHASPQHAADIAAAIPGAELMMMPGARHMLPRENKDRVNQLICEFLKRVVLQERVDVQ
jgi:pimeloyl-ACP methyl ester carboxylesterase